MGLLNKAESVAEYLVTFFFRKSAGSIQPVQVARELLRAMLRNKQISISNVYVPNVYSVHLNNKDCSVLKNFGETFRVELAKHLYEEGLKQGFTFLTPPVVEIKADEKLETGEIEIQVEFNESLVVPWQVEEEKEYYKPEELEKTTVLVNKIIKASSAKANPSRKMKYSLEIVRGQDLGKVFPIDKEEIIVGRSSGCDISVQDVEVSRKHFALRKESNRWFIQDLGSTNGTFVNKLRVDRYLVKPGDRIMAGQTQFSFKVEK
ncbi:MAG: FhaA domain-containing protein [Desulfitobacteriia bacterium]